MQKRFAIRERHRFQQDAVVAGAQRPVFGVEHDFDIFRGRRGNAVMEFDPRHNAQFFGRFPADIDSQGDARCPVTA